MTILNPVDEPNDAQTQKKLFIIIFSTENQTKKNSLDILEAAK